MSDRPYRTELRVVDPAELPELSRVDERPVDDPYRPCHEEYALMADWAQRNATPPDNVLLRWIWHPDKRVPMALLTYSETSRWIQGISEDDSQSWSDVLLERITRDLSREGVHWTPVLDTITSHANHSAAAYPVAWAAAFSLGLWIGESATPDDIRQILTSFQADWLRRGALTHAGCIDLNLAHEIYFKYAAGKHEDINALTQNVHLSDEVVAALGQWLVDDWEACIRRFSPVVSLPWPNLISLIRTHPEKVPADLLRRVYTFPALAKELGVRPLTPYEYHGPDEIDGASVASYDVTEFSDCLIESEVSLPSDVLCAMLPLMRGRPMKLDALLGRPDVDATVLREALARFKEMAVLRRMARNSELRWDPSIRPRLLRSADPDIQASLAEDADPETAAKLVRQLIANQHLDLVARALEARAPDNLIALDPVDLPPPLLQHDNPKLRLVAVRHLPQLEASKQDISAPRTSSAGSTVLKKMR